jgi:hypothetical protein
VAETATAYGQRDAAHNVYISVAWTPEDPDGERHNAWAHDFFDGMQPMRATSTSRRRGS